MVFQGIKVLLLRVNENRLKNDGCFWHRLSRGYGCLWGMCQEYNFVGNRIFQI